MDHQEKRKHEMTYIAASVSAEDIGTASTILESLCIEKIRNALGKYSGPNFSRNTPDTKINLKWINDLNLSPKTVKLLEENKTYAKNFEALGNDFFGYDPKT